MANDPFDYEQLDPGVRLAVRYLHAHGWETSDSGDGVSKSADEQVFDCPHVAVTGRRSYIPILEWLVDAADLLARHMTDWKVEASYDTETRVAIPVATDERKRVHDGE